MHARIFPYSSINHFTAQRGEYSTLINDCKPIKLWQRLIALCLILTLLTGSIQHNWLRDFWALQQRYEQQTFAAKRLAHWTVFAVELTNNVKQVGLLFLNSIDSN